MDRVPVAGLLRKEFRDDFVGRSGNAYRMAEARGKQAIGFATMTMAGLVFKDRITGGQPSSEIEANLPEGQPVPKRTVLHRLNKKRAQDKTLCSSRRCDGPS